MWFKSPVPIGNEEIDSSLMQLRPLQMVQTRKVGVQITKVIGMDLGERLEDKRVESW